MGFRIIYSKPHQVVY